MRKERWRIRRQIVKKSGKRNLWEMWEELKKSKWGGRSRNKSKWGGRLESNKYEMLAIQEEVEK